MGDLVLAWNEDTGEIAPKPVTALVRPEPKPVFALVLRDEDGGTETFEVTDDHPWMARGRGWIETVNLNFGDLIETSDGQTLEVAALEQLSGDRQTYNLSVAEWSTFLVGDDQAIVHNAGSRCFTLLRGTNTFSNRAARHLNERFGRNLTRREWGRALEELKAQNLLRPNDHGQLLSDGRFIFNGEDYGNIIWYVP